MSSTLHNFGRPTERMRKEPSLKTELEIPVSFQTRKPASGQESHTATGVMLFNGMGQLLFINDKAPRFLQQLQRDATRELGTCLIPEEVCAVVRELTVRLRECEHSEECESIRAERVHAVSGERLLIRGWCVPHETVVMKSRLLIVLERLQEPAASRDMKIQDRYHLTEREQMVIIYLMLGFTNKEIANRLNLSEHTVKEHLKRMMQKTHTTSRTGLLSCMIFPQFERSRQAPTFPLQVPPPTTMRPQEILTAVG